MAPNRETLRLLAEQRAMLAQVTDAQTRAVVAAWARAWDEIALDLERATRAMAANSGTATAAQARRVRIARQAYAIASVQLRDLCAAAGVRVGRDLERVIRLGAEGQIGLINTQLPPGFAVRFDRVDGRQLDAMVRRTTQQITARHYALADDASEAMRRELVRGMAAGDNPRTAAALMLDRVQDEFNGGMFRALTIARTEQLDSYRAAGKVAQQAHAGVLDGWMWVASLSNRTCRSCVAMHGSRHPLAEDGPIDHHQGRCARVPVTKSWRELGVTAPEPASAVPDADQWFRSLPAADQRAILTERGFEQWQAGRYPIGDWTHRRSTEGWRDAQVPSVPPVAR
ncbi:phage minor head protein [Propionibacteriaceae bacterium Y1700]|uniref:phage minor head protein n=1 Tax=Microlunatus sp. Y1700 TaxID=3418487 RepID=UPI003DA6DB51